MNDYVFWIIVGVCVVVMLVNRTRGKADPDEAHRLVESGALLVDVRSPGEYAAGHVEGAVNIPVGELGGRLGELPDRGRAVVVYCASGMRSAAAKKVLMNAGFTTVLDLGPMSRW